MKKNLAIIATLACFLTTPLANAGETNLLKSLKAYAAIGAAYGWNLDSEVAIPKFSSTWGFDAKAGMEILPIVAIEGEFSNLPSFNNRREFYYNDGSATRIDATFKLTAIMMNFKLNYPLLIKLTINHPPIKIIPYLIAGLGQMKMKLAGTVTRISASGNSSSASAEWESNNACYKFGGGIDIQLYRNLYLFGESAYWEFNDINIYHQIFYHSAFAGGISYKF